MHIEKRTLTRYIVLNCLTLGIYGFIVAKQMDKEINAICNGDKQQPGMSYVLAWLFSKLGGVFGGLYFSYWWYQQANRLKVNANRYGLTVKESGTDIFLMRGIMNVPLSVITALELAAAMLAPTVLALLFVWFAPILSFIILIAAGITLALFCNELTGGATIANYYMMKNLNRFADASRSGGAAFDPMGYEYYPCVAVKYPAMVGGAASAPAVVADTNEGNTSIKLEDEPVKKSPFGGVLVGEKGTCAGYKYDLNAGEEIIIGKDAKVASVVIDPAYKEISRKHVGVTYDIVRDQYCVVDYSSNGTWANGSKLTAGQPVYLPHGTELELANAKNKFLLG